MQWLSFLGYLAWNGISYATSKATSSIGFSIAAILAVFKANINQSLMLFILLIMCAMMIAGLSFMCHILAQAYLGISRDITRPGNSRLSIIVSFMKLILFGYLFFPIMYIMSYTIAYFPPIVLHVAGYHKEASFYLKEVMGNHHPGSR